MKKAHRTFLGSPFARLLRPVAVGLLRCAGWRAVGEAPREAKYVLVAAPHTSNWDGILLILIAMELRIELYWLGKRELFRWPVAWLMRWFGGVPVHRGRAGRLAAEVAEAFAASESLIVVIPPEATRGRAERWKSGFYRIARRSGVPIALGYLDFASRTGGIGPLLRVDRDDAPLDSDSVRRDMAVIREFYESKEGLHPERFGPVRL